MTHPTTGRGAWRAPQVSDATGGLWGSRGAPNGPGGHGLGASAPQHRRSTPWAPLLAVSRSTPCVSFTATGSLSCSVPGRGGG